jgi:hypothetical protein
MPKNMPKITLKKAVELLNECSGVIINDNTFVFPSVDEVKNEPDNEFLRLGWEEDGQVFRLTFTEEDNQEVSICGTSMFLIDSDAEDGEETQIMLLQPWMEQTDGLMLYQLDKLHIK